MRRLVAQPASAAAARKTRMAIRLRVCRVDDVIAPLPNLSHIRCQAGRSGLLLTGSSHKLPSADLARLQPKLQ